MRKVCLLLSVLFVSIKSISQTTLLNSTFETGDATPWAFANSNPNAWVVGSAVANGGTRSAYISNNNGNTNNYAPGVSTVSHLYTSVNFPSGQGAILLSFDIKGIGEHGTTVFDYVRVSLTPAVPVAGTMPSTADQLPIFLSAYASFNRVWIAIPSSYAGTTRNLVFTFRAGSTQGSTAFALDNVKLTSAAVAPLSGTKTIRATGGTYSSFSEAIATLNANGVNGALTFNVDAGSTFNETPTAITVNGAAASITFQKSGGGANPKIIATGSGNNRTTSTGAITTNTDAVIALASADRIVFDGIDFASANFEGNQSAIEYGVYVYNTSATNGSQNNIIRNAAITLNRTNLETRAILQDAAVTPTSVAGANSNNKYDNLTITNTFAGIELQGNANFPDLATEVGTTVCTSFNTIGAAGTANDIGNGILQTWGIRAAGQSGIKIFNNKISNVTTIGSGTTQSPVPVDGILVEDFLGANEVYNNYITGIHANNATSTSSASGMNISHNTTGANSIRVYNNFVSDIAHGYTGSATGNRYIKGIFISGTAGASTQTYAVDFNSVRIDGSLSPNTSSAALEVSTTSGPLYFIRNNVFSNYTAAQSSTAKHYAIVSPSAQRVGAAGSITSYNDLYVPNITGGAVAGGGTPTLNSYVTVSDFQNAFTGTANNLSVNPAFVSTTDLHINAAGLNGAADPAYRTASSWVTADIDCETRATAADIGADEFTPAAAACTTPSNPTGLVFSNLTASDASGNFTAPAVAPTGYIVVRSTGVLSASPVNGTSYAINTPIGNGTVVAAGSSTGFSLSGLNANTTYTVTVFPFNNTACSNGPVYNATTPLTSTFTTCPFTPASPAATGISTSSFQLSFTSSKAGGAAAVSYNLDVATDAAFATPVTGSPFTFTDTTTAQTTMNYTVTGLKASTLYYYRLRANGCNSNTVSGYATTLCGAVTAPYAESFENIPAANTLPVCMTASPMPSADGKTQTFVAAATATNSALVARTGTKFAAVYYNPNGPGYFFSAPLQLTGGVAYTASVYYKTNGVAWPALGLKYGTTATVAGMTTSIATVSNASATGYTQISGVFTPAASGVYYVSFYADNSNSNLPDYVAFDDFTVDGGGSSCAAPVMAAATAISVNGATLNWTAPVPAPASYEVYYSTSNTAPATATQPSVTGITGPSRTLNGLLASTTYYAWVRSNCGSGVSAWSESISFTTLCSPVNVPYTENFDGAATPNLPTCTTREDLNNDGSTWKTIAAPAGFSGKTLQYAYNLVNAANDWFYTTGLNLTAGTSYTLTFKYGKSSSIGTEKLKVAYGTGPTTTAMTNLLQDYLSVPGGSGIVNNGVLTFTPSATGVYYIGFQAYSAANEYELYLDDVAVLATPVLPANDEAAGAFTLTVGTGCTGAAFTNAGATKSPNEVFPSCSGTGQAPVWFKFVATGGAVRVSTDVGSGNTLTDSKIALFSATNPSNYSTFTILSCDDDNGSALGTGSMSVMYATGLTAGTTYYIAVDKASAATANGTFCITVDDLSSSMLSAVTQCPPASFQQTPAGSNTTYNAQVPLVDGASKLIAIVKSSAGDAVSSYTPTAVVSPVQRQAGGRYYLNRNFTVNNTSSKTASVQLFFLATELANLNTADGTTLATLAVTRQSGNGCQDNFTSGAGSITPLAQFANGTIDGVNWIEVPLPTGLSNLYANRAGTVLPVNLLSFSGQRQGAGNLLKWTVEQEQDIAAYEIERSEDNRNWTTAGSVTGLGNSPGRRSYAFADNNVQGLQQYYRLRQVDKNGAAKLSNTIVIRGTKATTLTLNGLYPNPAATKINLMIEAPAKSNLRILITDAVGKVVKTQSAFVEAGANALSVNVTGLSQGSYLVKVVCEDGCQTASAKFVKE